MTDRDPRIDPQPGDVLEREGIVRKVVGRGAGNSVIFFRQVGRHRMRGQKSISCWRRWAVSATKP